MNRHTLVQKFKYILENGDGGELIDFMCEHGKRLAGLAELGADFLTAQQTEDDDE